MFSLRCRDSEGNLLDWNSFGASLIASNHKLSLATSNALLSKHL